MFIKSQKVCKYVKHGIEINIRNIQGHALINVLFFVKIGLLFIIVIVFIR